ncbi:MAG: AraC family transcriptional regulator [Lachnospiraceae bacterium]|nr:AraC family transcriptional regulator [Lachnospiraceae bacterium]
MTRDQAYKKLNELSVLELLSKELSLLITTTSVFNARSNSTSKSPSDSAFNLMRLSELKPYIATHNPNFYRDFFQAIANELNIKPADLGNYVIDTSHYNNETYNLSANQKVVIKKHVRYSAGLFHDHEFFEIAYVLHGKCSHEFQVDNHIETTHLSDHELIIIPPGLSHKIEIFDDSLMVNILVHSQTFQSAFLNNLPADNILFPYFTAAIKDKFENTSYILINNKSPEVTNFVLDMYIEQETNDLYSSQISEHILQIFFLELLRHNRDSMSLSQTITESDKLAVSLRIFIENNYQKVSLDDVADNFHFSKTYINKIFKSAYNTTVLKYIKDLRIKEAQKLLSNSSTTITTISQMVGYNDTSYFIEEFKKATGVTPAAFRKASFSTVLQS